MGLCECGSSEDVDMIGGGGGAASKKKVIVGSAELSFKRDAMEIQPLFSDPAGISKLLKRDA